MRGSPWTGAAKAQRWMPFVLQNGEEAPIRFLFFEASTSVWVAIAIAIGIGIILDRLLITWWRRLRRAE